MTHARIVAVQAACVLIAALPAAAQVQRGTLYGTAHDATGAVLPGLVLQLTSPMTAPREAVAGGRGEFRFVDLDPGRYTLSATLDGFATFVRPEIIVPVGGYVEIPIGMVLAGVSAEVRVSAASPVLDVRRQGNVTNFDQVMLNEIPTARDPWALLQHLPGVSIGRPNVGGSESTNQAQFAARGDNGANTMWNIDGVTITDMAAIGASTTYYDFNVFEEVQFTTGGLDSRQQTGGLGINLVSKRGTNALRGSGRFYFTNDDLQGENISSDLRARGLSGNRIRQLAEYGADAGGPVRANRGWFWVGVGRTDVRQLAINGFPDNSIVNTAAARGDAEINPATRLSFFYHRGEKLKTGRGAGPDRPPETTWDQGGATHISKVEGSRVFEPGIFLTAKYAFVDLEFGLTPQGGLDRPAYRDFAAQVWHGSFNFSRSDRRQHQLQVDGDWSRGRHAVRFGFQHRRTASDEMGGWPGNGVATTVNLESQGLPRGVGLANISRQSATSSATRTVSFYAGDVMAFERWTVDLGLRVDRQRARNLPSAAPANPLAPSIMPALDVPGGPYRVWQDWSPRAGATFRVNARTIARASYARYASQLGSNTAVFENPGQAASIQYRFQDANGDNLPQLSELLAATGVVTNVDPANPSAGFAPNRVDPDLVSPSTHVLVAGIEREVMPNVSIGVSAGASRTIDTTWTPFVGLTRDDFVECTTCVISVPSTTAVYRLAPGVRLPAGNARLLTNRRGYARRYWNVDLTATRRLANRWMVRGHVTHQQPRESIDDPARAIQDPTPRIDGGLSPFASGLIDGGIAVNPGEFLIHATWMYSVAGLYELPWGLSASGTLYGRQGYPTGSVFTVNRPDGLGLTNVLVDRDLGASRFPALHLLDLRLQKSLALGGVRAVLTLDAFNTLNTDSRLRQFNEATSTSFRNPLEIVAPRLIRLGLQVRF